MGTTATAALSKTQPTNDGEACGHDKRDKQQHRKEKQTKKI
jgi:hypothetical protein